MRIPSATLLTAFSALLPLLAPPAAAQGYVCAEGGGSPTATGWGTQVFGWMLARGNNGPVVILGVAGADLNVASVFTSLGASSVTNLAVDASNANDPGVYAAITAAKIVWMRGGNQANYVNFWNNTLTEQAIRDVWQAGGVIGGTSAGCAVLGDWIYDSNVGSVLSREALRDPYHPFITFTDDFLNLLPGTITDTHFTERGRLGRLAVFVARAWQDAGLDLLGIGVDDRTALCVYPDGTAEVLGEGAVTLVSRSAATQHEIAPGQVPVFTGLVHHQLSEGYTYDLNTRSVTSRPPSAVLSPPPGPDPQFAEVALSGDDLGDAARGDVQVLDGGDSSALFYGSLQVVDGTNELLRTVVSTQTFVSTTWDENRVGGPQYALALNPHFLALYLDTGVRVQATAAGQVRIDPAVGTEAATVVLDSHGMLSSAFSSYVSSGASVGPRQSVALENARLHLLRSGMAYDVELHRPLDEQGASFCVGKPNTQGCTASVTLSGTSSATLAAPFTIGAVDVLPAANGILFYGYGAGSAPFLGGTLCVSGPIRRTPGQNSGGAAPCSGSYALDFNAYVQSGIDPALVPGQAVYAQYWYRDPLGTGGSGLSNGAAFTVGP